MNATVSTKCPYVCLFVGLASLAATGQAAPIVAGITDIPTKAIQDVTLFPGTPFNPTDAPIVIEGLFGIGNFGLNRQQQVDNTIDFHLVDAVYAGSLPGLGDYIFGAVGGLTGPDYTGQISSVVQDPNDPGFAAGDPSSFASGDYFVTGAQFAFEFLSGPGAGAVLFTDPTQNFAFVATLDGLPPSPGTLFTATGDQVLDVLFNGEPVGTSSNRRVLVIPEATTLLVALIGAASICLPGRRGLH